MLELVGIMFLPRVERDIKNLVYPSITEIANINLLRFFYAEPKVSAD